MSPFMRLFFWSRRAGWRAGAFGRLLGRLAVLALAVFAAVAVGQALVVVAVAVAAVIALVFILGDFTTQWRNAHVTVGRQYRRLAKKRGRS